VAVVEYAGQQAEVAAWPWVSMGQTGGRDRGVLWGAFWASGTKNTRVR
jgi:hypothetical protein